MAGSGRSLIITDNNLTRKNCCKVKNSYCKKDTVKNFKLFERTCVGVIKIFLFISSMKTRSLVYEMSENYKAV